MVDFAETFERERERLRGIARPGFGEQLGSFLQAQGTGQPFADVLQGRTQQRLQQDVGITEAAFSATEIEQALAENPDDPFAVRVLELTSGLPAEQRSALIEAAVGLTEGKDIVDPIEIEQTILEAARLTGTELGDVARAKPGPAAGVVRGVDPEGKEGTFDLGDPKQREEFVSGGFRRLPRREEVGGPGEFQTKKQAVEFQEAQANTQIFIDDIEDAQDVVRQNPGALTTVGGLALIGSNIGANIRALSATFNTTFENESVLDEGQYAETFDSLGIARGEFRSIFIGLSAQQAIINNPDGRISDRDIRTAMEQIGGGVQTAEGFIRITDRLAKRAVRIFRTRFREATVAEFEGTFGEEAGRQERPITDLGEVLDVDTRTPQQMTDEELLDEILRPTVPGRR